jgi:hypothetical protein
MLGQATAMLVPFPTTIAAKFRPGTLSFALDDQMRPFASPSVSVLRADGFARRHASIHRGLSHC